SYWKENFVERECDGDAPMDCIPARVGPAGAAGGLRVAAGGNREGNERGARTGESAAFTGSVYRVAFFEAGASRVDGDGEQSPEGEAPVRITPGGFGHRDSGGGGDYPLCRLLSQPDGGEGGAGPQPAPLLSRFGAGIECGSGSCRRFQGGAGGGSNQRLAQPGRHPSGGRLFSPGDGSARPSQSLHGFEPAAGGGPGQRVR